MINPSRSIIVDDDDYIIRNNNALHSGSGILTHPSNTATRAANGTPINMAPKRRNRRVHGQGWITKSALQERLEHIVLLELKEDGGREYRTMTLRELYNYVMKVLKYRPEQHDQHRQQKTNTDPRETSTTTTTSDENTDPIIYNNIMKPRPPTPGSPERNLLTGKITSKINHRKSITGVEETQQPHVVTYRERLGGYLHPRDMRRLVTPFSSSNEPELIVRRHVMLLNFDPLRAIVLRDRLLVLVPDGADSILISLEKSVRGGIHELQNQVFGEDADSRGAGAGAGAGAGSGDMSEVSRKDATSRVGAGAMSGVVVEEASSSGSTDPVVTIHFGGAGNIDEDSKTNDDDDDDDDTITHRKNQDPTTNYAISLSDSDQSLSTESGEQQQQQQQQTNRYDEWGDIEEMNWIEMTFELQCVDAVLSVVCKMLSNDSTYLRQKVLAVMEQLRDDSITTSPGDHVQEQFRILKDEVKEMEARVQGLVRAMNNILDDDEDMALMNLMRIITHPERFIQPVSQEILNEESDEPELILEAYMQQALSEVNALELLKGNIMNTEELVSLKMDTIRNRLLYMNTLVSVFSLCIATASLIGSLFGMNLTNHLEDDENAFMQVVSGTMAGCLALLVLLIIYISRSGVMPRYMHRLVADDRDTRDYRDSIWSH